MVAGFGIREDRALVLGYCGPPPPKRKETHMGNKWTAVMDTVTAPQLWWVTSPGAEKPLGPFNEVQAKAEADRLNSQENT